MTKTIMLDPGHGGRDPGAVNGTRHESADNLRLGLAIRDRLRSAGQDVAMTRDTDVFVGINERSALANRKHADIFVSLHRNAFSDQGANGLETIIGPRATAREKKWADIVQAEMLAVAPMRDRGVKPLNFGVLRDTTMPAMMPEVGFLTNTRDNQLFDDNFEAYADAIARGILKCLGVVPNVPAPGSSPPPAPVPQPPPSQTPPVATPTPQPEPPPRHGINREGGEFLRKRLIDIGRRLAGRIKGGRAT